MMTVMMSMSMTKQMHSRDVSAGPSCWISLLLFHRPSLAIQFDHNLLTAAAAAAALPPPDTDAVHLK